MSGAPLTWRNEKRRLSDLVPWEGNPRQIRLAEARRLEAGLGKFGQVQTIAVDPDGEIVDGHQRQLVWGAAEEYGPDFEVDVRVASRKLTENERRELVVLLHRGTVGEWNWDALASWGQEDELLEWGFEEYELGGYGDTDTDRNGQGVNTTWDAVRNAEQGEKVHVTIGDLETWLHYEIADELRLFLEGRFTTTATPIFETFEAIIRNGLDATIGDS